MQNKRVLIFIPEFPVRTETFIKREVSELVKRGKYKYKVFALKRGNGSLPPHLEKNLVYEKLSVGDVFKSLSLLITDLMNVFSALQVVGFDHFYVFLKGLGYAYKFSKYKPDVIYAHFFSDFSSIALVSSIILDVDLAIAAHARDVLEYPDLAKQKLKHAKFIVVCNKNAFDKIVELGGKKDPQNLKLVYHGLNEEDLLVSENIKKAEPPLVLCIARYVKKKGLFYLIEAAEKLEKKGLDFHVKIVGGGPLQKSLQERVDSLSMQDYIDLLGGVAFEDVKRFYHRCSVYVQPSVNTRGGDADGVPNTLIEAAMLKIPIVTTDAGSILDFLDEESAYVVSQRDSAALADAISDLIVHKNIAKNLVGRAYTKAKEMFDINKSTEEIERLLA